MAEENFMHMGKGNYLPRMARVARNRKMTGTETFIEMDLPDGMPLGHAPGQFVEVSVFGYGEAPISVCSPPSMDACFQLCVRAAGRTSRAIHNRSTGEWVGIRGPYGRGFPVDEMKGRDPERLYAYKWIEYYAKMQCSSCVNTSIG